MLKEKHMPIITSIAVVLAVLIVLTAVLSNFNKVEPYIEPNYISKLFDTNKVMQIDISIDETQWNKLLENAIAEEFVPCDVTINGEKLNTVGIRAKGNSSLSQVANDDTTDRYSFKLDFSEYIDGQNLYGLDTMALNNMISDPTYMKEYISYDMMSEMGVNTPAYSYSNITLNGKKWGLYLAVELLEEDFLTRYYGTNYGNLYKPESMQMGGEQGEKGKQPNGRKAPQGGKPQGDKPEGEMPQGQMPNMGGENSSTSLVYTDDSLSSYSGIFDDIITESTTNTDKKKVVEMIKNLNNGTNLAKHLDIDEILRYFAVNTFLVNLDSYAGSLKHNYYLYEDNGIFTILSWDFNLAFGSFQMKDSSKIINFPVDAPVTDTMGNSPLIAKLLEVDEYKDLYHQYLDQLVTTYITSGNFDNEITRLDTLISDYVKNDSTAFYTYDEYTKSLEELRTYGTDRAKSVLSQLSAKQPTTTYGNIKTSLNLASLGSMGGGNGMGDKEKNQGGGMGGMPNNEIMQEVMEIVQAASDREFTESEFLKLKELGIEENMIPQIKQMGNRGMPPNMMGSNTSTSNIMTNVIKLIPYILAIMAGIIFTVKYKRKKYS